jgi:DNA-directed RNA polymerase subunit RPC12/RpoP
MNEIKITAKQKGDTGEKEVVKHVSCPNCGNKLMILPPSYPLYDIQCTACSFRSQVKTSHSAPKDAILGAGWEIIDKVTKSGYMVPSLIVNFKWIIDGSKKQIIIFYPFIPKINLKKRTLSKNARRANYQMFGYTSLNVLPSFVLFEK